MTRVYTAHPGPYGGPSTGTCFDCDSGVPFTSDASATCNCNSCSSCGGGGGGGGPLSGRGGGAFDADMGGAYQRWWWEHQHFSGSAWGGG
jgi:hypothetical protein